MGISIDGFVTEVTLADDELEQVESFTYKALLAVAARRVDDTLTLLMGDGLTWTVPLSYFEPSGTTTPDFQKLKLTDFGNTVCWGNYEASVAGVVSAARQIGEYAHYRW